MTFCNSPKFNSKHRFIVFWCVLCLKKDRENLNYLLITIFCGFNFFFWKCKKMRKLTGAKSIQQPITDEIKLIFCGRNQFLLSFFLCVVFVHLPIFPSISCYYLLILLLNEIKFFCPKNDTDFWAFTERAFY